MICIPNSQSQFANVFHSYDLSNVFALKEKKENNKNNHLRITVHISMPVTFCANGIIYELWDFTSQFWAVKIDAHSITHHSNVIPLK